MTARAQQGSFVPDWARDAIFYQIFPERFANGDPRNDPPGTEKWGGVPKSRSYFGGDLEGILRHLDYISSLGVNALYLTPIFESPSNHKYHTTDYLRVDPHFGTEKTLKRLIDSCHARGIRIILDGVFNHTGVDFFAFADIKKNGARSPYLGWYNIYSLPVGPPSKPNYECWWGLGELPKLMTTNPDVQQYLFRATRHWMELGIDGWRLDVPNEIPHQFWIEWRKLVKSINPQAYIVGEIWDDATPWLKGDQFDAVMNYRFQKACVQFFAKGTMNVTEFDSTLAAVRAEYPSDVTYALQNLLGSHDTERFLTSCGGNVNRMKLAVLFQAMYVGAPMIYYGDEVGMMGGNDPGSRGTMVWDPSKQRQDLLEFYRTVFGLRNVRSVLRRGEFRTLLVDDARGIYVFMRSNDEGRIKVAINVSGQRQRIMWPALPDDQAYRWEREWTTFPKSKFQVWNPRQSEIEPLGASVLIGSPEK